MLTYSKKVSNTDIKDIANFFDEFDKDFYPVSPDEAKEETSVSKYVNSLVTGHYAKSVENIHNTKVGNKIVRKRNLQQVMRESFFYGANRFGNNFIA